MSLNPLQGGSSTAYFIKEVTRGVVPTNPAFELLRTTGGLPQATMDAILSEEIGNGREITDVDLGNINITGSFAAEFSFGSQDALLAASQGSDWSGGATIAGLDVTVDATAKTFTRSSGDYISDGVEVGSLIKFPSLTGQNGTARFVTAVTATVVTVGGVKDLKPLTDETANTSLVIGDSCPVGTGADTFTVLIRFVSKDASVTKYIITTGVEIGGWSMNIEQNAKVSAEFPIVGYDQYFADALPAGATLGVSNENIPYSNVNSSLMLDGEVVGGFTSFGFSSDNSVSAQFTIGSDLSAFTERSNIANTISGSAFAEDTALLEQYRNRTTLRAEVILSNGSGGVLAVVAPKSVLTEVTPERSNASTTVNVAGQAIGNELESSIILYRMAN